MQIQMLTENKEGFQDIFLQNLMQILIGNNDAKKHKKQWDISARYFDRYTQDIMT